jgi:O-antigen/teichoic acid export membrane protein
VEFGKHITKGIWAFADKSLPPVYGLGFVFLVIRVLPANEYGAFVIIQTILTFSTSLCYALALQPLTKFTAENAESGPYVTAGAGFSLIFYGTISLAIVLLRPLLIPLLDAGGQSNIGTLLFYLPLLFCVSFYRNIAVSFLQAKYQVRKIFWIDAVYFLGVLLLIFIASLRHRFASAEDLLQLTALAYICSTLLAFFISRREMTLGLSFKRAAMQQIWDYGKYTFGATVIYNMFIQADVFFVSSTVGLAGVATYNAAKILTKLFDMLVQVIQMFILPLSSKLHAEGNLGRLRIVAEKAIMFSLLILLPVFVAMFFFPSVILSVLYKGKYAEGASVMAIFAFLAFVMPWNAVCGTIIQGIGRVKYGFKMSGLLLLLSGVTYSILTPMYGMNGAAGAYLLVMAIITIIITMYTQRLLHFTLGGIVSRIADVGNFLRNKIPN